LPGVPVRTSPDPRLCLTGDFNVEDNRPRGRDQGPPRKPLGPPRRTLRSVVPIGDSGPDPAADRRLDVPLPRRAQALFVSGFRERSHLPRLGSATVSENLSPLLRPACKASGK
jgi:hypothetical protein